MPNLLLIVTVWLPDSLVSTALVSHRFCLLPHRLSRLSLSQREESGSLADIFSCFSTLTALMPRKTVLMPEFSAILTVFPLPHQDKTSLGFVPKHPFPQKNHKYHGPHNTPSIAD